MPMSNKRDINTLNAHYNMYLNSHNFLNPKRYFLILLSTSFYLGKFFLNIHYPRMIPTLLKLKIKKANAKPSSSEFLEGSTDILAECNIHSSTLQITSMFMG